MLHTYFLSISSCSFGSSKALIGRSEMLTAAEAVKVTSSTREPSPSSRGSSSLWVCSLLRVDRSTWHLERNSFHQYAFFFKVTNGMHTSTQNINKPTLPTGLRKAFSPDSALSIFISLCYSDCIELYNCFQSLEESIVLK